MSGIANLFDMQSHFQKAITGIDLPCDSPKWFEYHMVAMIEELGEVLKADKRWKTHRNTRFERDEKLDEISDCFITLINIALFSGFSDDDIADAIENKIKANMKRLSEEEK